MEASMKLENSLQGDDYGSLRQIGSPNTHGISTYLIAEKDGEMRVIPFAFAGDYDKSTCPNSDCLLNTKNGGIEIFVNDNPLLLAFLSEVTDEVFQAGKLLAKKGKENGNEG